MCVCLRHKWENKNTTMINGATATVVTLSMVVGIAVEHRHKVARAYEMVGGARTYNEEKNGFDGCQTWLGNQVKCS